MKTLLLLLAMLLPWMCQAQYTEHYFNDAEGVEGGRIYDYIKDSTSVIIGGHTNAAYDKQPVIFRVDTMGDVVWSTTTFDTASYEQLFHGTYVYRMFLSDGYIYALVIENDWPDDPKEFWKIDAATGEFVWRMPFYPTYFAQPPHVIDYDSSSFLIGYRESWNYRKFAFISKSNGDTLSTHYIANTSSPFGMAVDDDLNIYHTLGTNVVKRYANDPDSIIWQETYPAADIEDFHHIYFDDNDSMYVFGNRDASLEFGKVLEINKATGGLNWHVSASYGDVAYQDMVDKNGYFYIAWRHIYVGGGDYRFWGAKVEKATGDVEFISYPEFTEVGVADGHSGNGTGAMSIDVDDNGDVFLTGYYRDANYGPEAWGIRKIDGDDGTKKYDRTITEDSSRFDNLSVGMISWVYNNRPLFIGHLQTTHPNYYEKTRLAFIELANNSGSVIQKKFLNPGHQFPSKTLEMVDYSYDKTLVLKQTGPSLRVENHAYNGGIHWERDLSISKYLEGQRIMPLGDGTILVTALSSADSSDFPFHSAIHDTAHLFWLNANGGVINHQHFPIGEVNARITEIVADSARAFVFYQTQNDLYCRRVTSSQITAESDLNIVYKPIPSHSKYASNFNGNKIIICGRRNGSNRIMELNKTTLTITNLATISFFNHIHHTELRYSNDLYIAGSNSSDAIMRYDLSNLSVDWDQNFASNGSMRKFDLDATGNHVYTVSYRAQDAVVRKIRTSDGVQLWSEIFNGPANLADEPMDIAYDDVRQEVFISGTSRSSSTNKDVFIERIDLNGIALDTIIRPSDFEGVSDGFVTHTVNNGSIWVGGHVNHETYREAGFIYTLEDPLFCQASVSVSACASYTPPSGNHTWTTAGIHTDTLSGTSCDSVIFYDLTLLSTSDTTPLTECTSYIWPASGDTLTSSGFYSDTLTNGAGCDSIAVLDLTIIDPVYGAEDTVEVCDSYLWPLDSNTYTSSGNYSAVFVASSGCDSLVTLELTIPVINTGISDSQLVLTANEPNASYQWFECSDGYDTLVGDTFQTFVANDSGNFAVVIMKYGCVDTSACLSGQALGVASADQPKIKVYPNPSDGRIFIDLPDGIEHVEVDQYTFLGQHVQQLQLTGKGTVEGRITGAAGVYILVISYGDGQRSFVRVRKY